MEKSRFESCRTCGWLRQVSNSFDKMARMPSAANEIAGRTKVVIVGAGIAGLAAAKTLEDAGFKDYLLVEAQSSVGGRIRSVPWNRNWIECGAQFLHGDRSELAKLSYRHQLLSDVHYKDGEGTFIVDDGMKMTRGLERLLYEVDDLVRDALEECENYENRNIPPGCENVGKLLRYSLRQHSREANESTSTKDLKEEIFDWHVRFLMIDNSCFTLDDLSAKHWGKFKFVGGPEHLSFKSGYSSLVELIADDLTEKNVKLNTALERIEWHETTNEDDFSPITLTLSNDTRVQADCVIITSSLGYLKENHARMFSPSLPPSLVRGIESLGFGVINKIFLDFGAPWWSPKEKGFQFLWRKAGPKFFRDNSLAAWTRDLTGFDVLPTHRGVLLGWVGGRGAYVIETLTEQQVAVDCENLLKHYLKVDNMPPVKKCERTRWHANKYVRGAYSHITTKCDHNGVTPATLAEPVWGSIVRNNCNKDVPIIMLAGEATHEHFYSTTHGAYDTGVNQARLFLKQHVAKR